MLEGRFSLLVVSLVKVWLMMVKVLFNCFLVIISGGWKWRMFLCRLMIIVLSLKIWYISLVVVLMLFLLVVGLMMLILLLSLYKWVLLMKLYLVCFWLKKFLVFCFSFVECFIRCFFLIMLRVVLVEVVVIGLLVVV